MMSTEGKCSGVELTAPASDRILQSVNRMPYSAFTRTARMGSQDIGASAPCSSLREPGPAPQTLAALPPGARTCSRHPGSLLCSGPTRLKAG